MTRKMKEEILDMLKKGTASELPKRFNLDDIGHASRMHARRFIKKGLSKEEIWKKMEIMIKDRPTFKGGSVSEFISEICLRFPQDIECECEVDNKKECLKCAFKGIFAQRAHVSCYTYVNPDLNGKSLREIIDYINKLTNMVKKHADVWIEQCKHSYSTIRWKLFENEKRKIIRTILRNGEKADWCKIITLVNGHMPYREDIWRDIIQDLEKQGITRSEYDKWLSPDYVLALQEYGKQDHTEYIQYVKNTSIFFREGIKHHDCKKI
jgi:hypothetical protein